mmetsp:Transcript_18093/g.28560  ORF Transcript_18093/g.28560 Transcript_18093/m.28560 type:complete len:259 (-) Transcript_18093:120-896(-)
MARQITHRKTVAMARYLLLALCLLKYFQENQALKLSPWRGHPVLRQERRQNIEILLASSVATTPTMKTSATQLETQKDPIEQFIMLGFNTLASLASGTMFGALFSFATQVGKQGFQAALDGCWTQGRTWGELGAAFTFFEGTARIIRQTEDKYNNLIAAFFAGCYLSRADGPRAMMQQGLTYLGFNAVFAMLPPPQQQAPTPEEEEAGAEAVLLKKQASTTKKKGSPDGRKPSASAPAARGKKTDGKRKRVPLHESQQ